ncbi:MAG: twin-arginine translocase TatA/TatE family subunit [Gemmatimonadaceae bacterium]|nr:twin-arginine translocase TatA/TatE family subunit [Gemmatimonadaceae bacterium]
MPFGLGMGEMVIGLVIVLLLFGAKRIPEIAGAVGKGINQFKRNVNEVDKSLRDGEMAARTDAPRIVEPPLRIDDPSAEPKRLI